MEKYRRYDRIIPPLHGLKPTLQLTRKNPLLFNELAVVEFRFVYYGFSFYEWSVFVF